MIGFGLLSWLMSSGARAFRESPLPRQSDSALGSGDIETTKTPFCFLHLVLGILLHTWSHVILWALKRGCYEMPLVVTVALSMTGTQ